VVVVEPIRDNDIDDVCAFWRKNFNSRCSQEIWVRAFRRQWHKDKPNNGFLLRDGAEIVGALGAIYSQQRVGTQLESFCNMTNWYVLENYRTQSMALFLRLIRQKGHHFTNFSANPTVAKILPSAGFKLLPSGVTGVPNLAFPVISGMIASVVDDPAAIAQLLPHRRDIALDHADCAGVRQLALGTAEGGYSHILFGRGTCRSLPCAVVYDVSDASLLKRHWHRFAAHMLYRVGAVVTRFETQMLAGEKFPLAFHLSNSFETFLLSPTLRGETIRPLYSEIVALQGC
jgi:hypothetical protein